MAYEEERKARIAVNKTVAPMPMYLLVSEGVFSSNVGSIPAQKIKNCFQVAIFL
jgi:hypothetical protein